MTDSIHELLEALSETTGRIRELALEGADRQSSGSADEWGPAQVVAHLVDSERVDRGRLQAMLQREGAYFKSFDQAALARDNDYASKELRAVLEEFATERAETIQLLMNLPLKGWERTGIHERWGEVSLEDLVERMVDHDAEHIQQIEAWLQRQT